MEFGPLLAGDYLDPAKGFFDPLSNAFAELQSRRQFNWSIVNIEQIRNQLRTKDEREINIFGESNGVAFSRAQL